MKTVLDIAKECGAYKFRNFGDTIDKICFTEAQLTAFIEAWNRQNSEPVADKMREDFEAWRKKYTLYKENKYYSRTVDKAEYDDLETQSSWLAYQAATAESTAKIAELEMELAAWQGLHESAQIQKAQMQARIDELVDVLIPAKEKLQIYREHSTGEYQGGMEYTQLVNLIDEALAKFKDVNNG